MVGNLTDGKTSDLDGKSSWQEGKTPD